MGGLEGELEPGVWADGWLRWMVGPVDRWLGGWVGGWVGGWMGVFSYQHNPISTALKTYGMRGEDRDVTC